MISFTEMKSLFPVSRGTNDSAIEFKEIYVDSEQKVVKGLYVSLINDNCEVDLKKALYNGAIGAVWDEKLEIPRFLPNHFPIFLVEDTCDALQQLILYIKKNRNNDRCKMEKYISLSLGNKSYNDVNTNKLNAYKVLLEETNLNERKGS